MDSLTKLEELTARLSKLESQRRGTRMTRTKNAEEAVIPRIQKPSRDEEDTQIPRIMKTSKGIYFFMSWCD